MYSIASHTYLKSFLPRPTLSRHVNTCHRLVTPLNSSHLFRSFHTNPLQVQRRLNALGLKEIQVAGDGPLCQSIESMHFLLTLY